MHNVAAQKIKKMTSGLKRYGIQHIAEVLSGKLPNWLFYFNHSYLGVLAKTEINEMVPEGYLVRRAGYDDIPAMVKLGKSESLLRRRLDRGDLAVIALKDGEIASICWANTGRLFIENAGAILDTGENGFYLYDAYTRPEYRAKRLHLAIHNFQKKYFYEKGIDTGYNCINVYNEISLNISRKKGFKPRGRSIHFKVFGLNFTYYPDWPHKTNKLDIFFKKPDEYFKHLWLK